MSSISIDSKTYQRLEQYSQRARVSIHAAASDAIENWLDITSDPRLAITALSTIAKTQPDPLANPGPGAPAALPPECHLYQCEPGPFCAASGRRAGPAWRSRHRHGRGGDPMNANPHAGMPLNLSAVVAAAPSLLPASSAQSAELPAQRRLPAYLACPRCHCKAVHRSRRRGLDWLMSAIGFLPARCFTCERRFYVRSAPVGAKSQPSA